MELKLVTVHTGKCSSVLLIVLNGIEITRKITLLVLFLLLIVLNGIEITSLYGKVHVVCLLIVLNGIEIWKVCCWRLLFSLLIVLNGIEILYHYIIGLVPKTFNRTKWNWNVYPDSFHEPVDTFNRTKWNWNWQVEFYFYDIYYLLIVLNGIEIWFNCFSLWRQQLLIVLNGIEIPDQGGRNSSAACF